MRSSRGVLPLLLCVAAACGGRMRIESYVAPGADLSRSRVYGWATAAVAAPRRPSDATPPVAWRVRDAVDRELAAKGYALASASAPADFLMGSRITVQEKETNTFRDLIEYRAAGGTKDAGESFVQGYHEGTLVLEATDARTGELAWHASARVILDETDPQADVEEAVRAMLARFPSR